MGYMQPTKLVLLLIFMVVILGSNPIAAQTLFTSNGSDPGTNLIQIENISRPMRQSDDTIRVDPLDHFKKYRGGYDITNKHYWSSTIFTGVSGYVMGVLWLLFGIAYGGYVLATIFCYKTRRNKKPKKQSPCHKQCYLWPIFSAIIFTILAIIASGLVLGGNAKFHSRARTIVNIVIDTADDASETIYNTTRTMGEISINLEASNDSSVSSASGFLTSTAEKFEAQAADIQRQARKNRRSIDKGLKIVYILTTVTISLNLAAVIALSVCGSLKLQRAHHLLIVLCWLLTILCWLFFGLHFFLDKFSNDTCTALENFQENPYNNSLSSILPCDEMLSAKPLLTDVSAGIYSLVNEVNANMSAILGTSNGNIYVCNPFSGPPEYQYQQDCPANSIRIGEIPQLLQMFTCSDSNSTCNLNGQVSISTSVYKTVEAYTTSVQDFLDAYPSMESLVECQPVKNAFSEILLKHCKPLKKYVHMVWASMLLLSLITMFLVLIWATQACNEQEHHSLDGSVKPHSATTEKMENESKQSAV